MSARKTSASPGSAGDAGTATLPKEYHTGSTAQGATGSANIPRRIRDLRCFLNWFYKPNKKDPAKEPTKAPCDVVDGIETNGTKGPLAYWSYAEAANSGRGIGVALGFLRDDILGDVRLAGVDLDDCLDEIGMVVPERQADVDALLALGTYVEVSPSATGLHALCIESNDARAGKNVSGVEIYNDKRYFTFTGRKWPGSADDLADVDLDPWRKRLGGVTTTTNDDASPSLDGYEAFAGPLDVADLTNDERVMLDQFLAASPRNRSLYEDAEPVEVKSGPSGGIDSEADFQLALALYAVVGPDARVIGRLARTSSARYRGKWDTGRDETDWLGYTIGNALRRRRPPFLGPLPQAAQLPAQPSSANDWSDPDPLPGEGLSLPELEPHMLPPVLSKYVFSQASVMGCDPILIALPALVGAGAMLGSMHQVLLDPASEWRQAPRLWGAAVAESGSKKSGAADAALAGVHSYSAELNARSVDAQRLADESGQKVVVPFHTLVATSATPAGAAHAMQDNPRGLFFPVDELVGWIAEQDAYNGGGGSDRAFWLTANDGGPFTMLRAKGNRIHVPSAGAAIFGGIQPSMLPTIHKRTDLTKDGLLMRFIVGYASDTKRRRDPSTASPDARSQFLAFFRWLGQQADRMDYTLSPQAANQFNDYREVIDDCIDVETFPAFRSHLAKFAGMVGRVALIMHAADCWPRQQTSEIASGTMARAIELMGRYFYSHSAHLYGVGLAFANEEAQLATQVSEVILTQGLKQFTKRTLHNAFGKQTRDWLTDQRKRDKVFATLEMRGWIRATEAPTQKAGRPPEFRFDVNPLVNDGRFATQRDRMVERRAAISANIRKVTLRD